MALSEIYSISIKTVAPQKRFKLLELPPELLTLLESEERPST